MYRYELFERLHQNGWSDYLGKGSFSSVWGNPNVPDWVIKFGENDGTRTYLEWVMLRTAAGKRMKGMPEVEWIVPIGACKYLVAMKRLHKRVTYERESPDYITELKIAFKQETGVDANDAMFGNIMQDAKGELVLTDPSSWPYRPLGVSQLAYDFELAHSPSGN